jgi:lysophospholipid acyltransferase (LPLAT)-like uncharacterized protein
VPHRPKRQKRWISRAFNQWLARTAGVPLAYYLIRLLKLTWEIERVHVERARLKPCIFAIFHADLLVAAYELPLALPNVDVLASRSRDGTLVAHFVHMFRGVRTFRGGSSKGATGALLLLRRSVLKGRAAVIAVDGPRGPAGIVKPGVIALASQSGVPIIPGAIMCDKAWRMKSWDRMMLCKPGARVKVIYGEPFYVARDLERLEFEARRLDLERVLKEMHQTSV